MKDKTRGKRKIRKKVGKKEWGQGRRRKEGGS